MKRSSYRDLKKYNAGIQKTVTISAEDIRQMSLNMNAETRGIWLHSLLVELHDFSMGVDLQEIGDQLTVETILVLEAIFDSQVHRIRR